MNQVSRTPLCSSRALTASRQLLQPQTHTRVAPAAPLTGSTSSKNLLLPCPNHPDQPGWNNSWGMSQRKTNQEMDLGFICCFVCFVTVFVCFPLQVYFKSTLSSPTQNSANMTEGEAEISITTEQQNCPREVAARVEL